MFAGAARQSTKGEMALNAVFSDARFVDHLLRMLAEPRFGDEKHNEAVRVDMALEYVEIMRGQLNNLVDYLKERRPKFETEGAAT